MEFKIINYVLFFLATSVSVIKAKPSPLANDKEQPKTLLPREHTAHVLEQLATEHHAFSIPSPRPPRVPGSKPDPNTYLLGDGVPGSKAGEKSGAWAKIIGGTPAPQDRWPWSVALDTVEYGHICSGTLIGMRWVLAAAHCIAGAPVTVYARIGAWNLSVHDELDIVRVENIIVHPQYGAHEHKYEAANAYDIALLKLNRVANVSSADILSLPDYVFNLFVLNPFCIAIGWGMTDTESSEMSDVLNELAVRVITPVECQIRWNDAFTQPSIYPSQLCLDEGMYGNVSACHGDSGSPLQCYDIMDGRWKLAGFASWGSEACHTYPSVYMRVQFFLDWIYSVVASNPEK